MKTNNPYKYLDKPNECKNYEFGQIEEIIDSYGIMSKEGEESKYEIDEQI